MSDNAYQSSTTAANDCHVFAAELDQINRHQYQSIEAEAPRPNSKVLTEY